MKKVPEDNGGWTILDGNWHMGIPKGLGVCKYSDGSQYEGEWVDG